MVENTNPYQSPNCDSAASGKSSPSSSIWVESLVLFGAAILLCIAVAPFIGLSLLAFAIFGLPARVTSDQRSGWVTGALFGTIAFVLTMFSLAVMPMYFLADGKPSATLILILAAGLLVSLVAGIYASYREGRSAALRLERNAPPSS